MSQRDLFHDLVKNALIAEGWQITHDPYPLSFGDPRTKVYIDLGAEMPLAAEKEGRKIAVEVKSFIGPSPITDLERALGQFTLYHFLLARRDPQRTLYVAIPETAFTNLFDPSEGRDLVSELNLRLIVYRPEEGRIVQWIP